jgi:hypothetical protein
MPRGRPDNLRAAAQRKREAATGRAETALRKMVSEGKTITFRGLARAAGVSVDFLYRSPLRSQVEHLRGTQQANLQTKPETLVSAGTSNVVRAMSAQLRELKRRHREEVHELRTALAAAQGENLELRRVAGRTRRGDGPD